MTVYLLHFSEPIGNPSTPHGMAQHYIGWSPEPAERIARHASGDGARIIRYVMDAGIGFELAQTWEGGPELEKRLKRRKCAPRFCRVCIEERREQRERDELLQQMDWERELAEAMSRAEATVTGHERGEHAGQLVPGCFGCVRARRTYSAGTFGHSTVEAEEAAETIDSRR